MARERKDVSVTAPRGPWHQKQPSNFRVARDAAICVESTCTRRRLLAHVDHFRTADYPRTGLACAQGALVETDLQCHLLDRRWRIANMPIPVVALPEQVGDHERATSFQGRNSHLGAVLETGDRVGARGPGKPPGGRTGCLHDGPDA